MSCQAYDQDNPSALLGAQELGAHTQYELAFLPPLPPSPVLGTPEVDAIATSMSNKVAQSLSDTATSAVYGSCVTCGEVSRNHTCGYGRHEENLNDA